MEHKKWKNYEQQLEILRERGLKINDEKRALNYLERLGYYRLSGYWYPFRLLNTECSNEQKQAIRSDFFRPQSTFENIVDLYIFDKQLRLLAIDALERIEMALRTDIAYLLGERDPFAHERADCLHSNFSVRLISKGKEQGKTLHEIWLNKYRDLLRRSSKQSLVAHHQRYYDGHLPIWVAIEIWDLGLLSHLFSGLKFADKQKIAEKYKTDGETLAKWLKSLNFIRNVAAHHSRLWNNNILELSPATNEWKLCKNYRPFMYFCIMQHLLNVICPNSTWGKRLTKLLEHFPEPENQAVALNDFGIVDEWQKWDIWQK